MGQDSFFQDGPELGNQYEDDPVLQGYLKRVLPPSVLTEIEPDLKRMGARAATDILALGREAEARPPHLISRDPWGRPLGRVETSRAWKELHAVSAREGLVAIAYERKYGPFSRVHQFAKIYLFHPSSAFYSCPLAMADGAARTLEIHGDPSPGRGAFSRLTSRDPDLFWVSGQWMTERQGGSDVGGTATTARAVEGGWALYGEKWFASAAEAPLALVLARPEGAAPGSAGLSLFAVEPGDPANAGKVRVLRLKDKMGTRALPTAELLLEGLPGFPVGDLGGGVKKISTLFNITRVHNAVDAAAMMRRGLALARDYAWKRKVSGKSLAEIPLHLETLAGLEVEFRGAFALAFRAAELLGRVEAGVAAPRETALLRVLTPLAKLATGKQAVEALGEAAECFGGAGYVEDTGIPVLLRDAHVLPIWEGTTNVLCMDVLRAINHDGALGPLLSDLEAKLSLVRAPSLAWPTERVREVFHRIEAPVPPAEARVFALSLARLYAGALLLEQAQWETDRGGGRLSRAAAQRWCSRDLWVGPPDSPGYLSDSQALALPAEGT